MHDVVAELVKKSPASPSSPPPSTSAGDPADLDKGTLKRIVKTLSEIMRADADAEMGAKALRLAAADRLGMEFRTKAWKKWFDERVAELDDKQQGEGEGGDDDGDSRKNEKTPKNSKAGGGGGSSSSSSSSSSLPAAPKMSKCSDALLDQLEDEISRAVAAGVVLLDPSELRARVGAAVGLSLEDKEWVKYVREAAADCRAERHAAVKEPEHISKELRGQLRAALKALLRADEDQTLDAKGARQAVSEQVGVVFKSKVGVASFLQEDACACALERARAPARAYV